LDGVEDERLALVASSFAQRIRNQRDQFTPCREFLGVIGRGVGNNVLLEHPVVRLVKLQYGFVSGLDVLLATRALQRNVAPLATLVTGGRQGVDGLARQAMHPRLQLYTLGSVVV